MSSIFRQYRARFQFSNKEDHQLKNISNKLDKLFNENRLLKTRFDQLDERYQQWIDDERIYLLKRIEKLEHKNHQLLELYQTSQIQNSQSIQSITNLILKILLTQQTNRKKRNMTSQKKRRFQNLFGQCFLPRNTQLTSQELRKQSIDRHNVNDPVQWRIKQQQDKSTRSLSYPLNDSRYTINDQSIWLHQVKEQDQKTRNYSSELTNHSSTLATVKSKTDKSSAALSNKLYYVLNNEKPASTRDNYRSTGVNIIPVDNANINSRRKQQSSVTFNKNQAQTRSAYSNHERLPTQTPYRTSPIVKNTPAKTTTTTPRIPTITVRPPTTNTRPRPPLPPPTNQKTTPSSSTTNKPSPRPRYALPKPTEPLTSRSVGATTHPRSGQTTTTKPNTSPSKNTKTRIPIVPQQPARVTDLDAAIAEQQKQKPTIITPPKLIQRSLFSKNTVKHVRPVRSQELKLFSCHLTPEVSVPKNESLSTLTPSSYESINDNQSIEKQNDDFDTSSNISGVFRDFSEDSLNEHHHIQKLLQHNSTSIEPENTGTTIKQSYFLSADEDLNPPYAPPSSLIKPKPPSSFVHRLVFPERIGRLVFYRQILSDSDIYQKICSQDQEILHNVYHLDTIRDKSMEFYMLTTYASDSQLRAWLNSDDDDDDDDDEVEGHFKEDRFLSSDDEMTNDQRRKRMNSSDSLIQDEELDWCSELESLNLNTSNENYLGDSSDLTSTSWSVPVGAFNQLHSTPLPSDLTDPNNLLLREILNHSWTEHISTSSSIEQETGIEQLENDSTSSIITDEFQRDFYYLCPITKTTSFSKTDSKT